MRKVSGAACSAAAPCRLLQLVQCRCKSRDYARQRGDLHPAQCEIEKDFGVKITTENFLDNLWKFN